MQGGLPIRRNDCAHPNADDTAHRRRPPCQHNHPLASPAKEHSIQAELVSGHRGGVIE